MWLIRRTDPMGVKFAWMFKWVLDVFQVSG